MSALGDDPDAWAGLSDDTLKQVVTTKCIECGVSEDGARVPTLFALYQHAKSRLDSSERMQPLVQFSAMTTEEQMGQGHMGLMMLLLPMTILPFAQQRR